MSRRQSPDFVRNSTQHSRRVGIHQDPVDEACDLTHVFGSQTAGGSGRRTEPDTRSDVRFLGIVQDGVFIDGDADAVEDLFGPTARQTGFGLDID